MKTSHIAAAALAIAFLATGCATKPAPATRDNTLITNSVVTGSGGNVGDVSVLDGTGGSGAVIVETPTSTPGTLVPGKTVNGGGGNTPAFDSPDGLLVPGKTVSGSGGNVPAQSPEFDGTGGSGGVVPNQ